MHDRQPSLNHNRLSRRRLFSTTAAALGALVVQERLDPEAARAPEPPLGAPERYIDQAEIDELEVNLDATAEKYGLQRPSRDAVDAALSELKAATSGGEIFSITSTFTEHQFGFSVIDTTREGVGLGIGSKMEQLLGYLSLFPREFYESIDLEKIDIGKPPLANPGAGMIAASFTTPSEYEENVGNTITFTPTYSDTLYIVLHELSHGLDYAGRLGDGRRAANEYLNSAYEPERIADEMTEWIMGNIQDDQMSMQLTEVIDRFDTLAPSVVPYIEEAVRPYIRTFTESKRGYHFFQPVEQ